MKIAVVGTGAAAFGATLGLTAAGAAEIDYFDAGAPKSEPAFSTRPPREWSRTDFRHVLDGPRRQDGWSFVPAYSHFGDAVPKHAVSGPKEVFESRDQGGLTRYWSASMFNFVAADFADWPVGAAELDPHYAAVAEAVGVSGDADGLDVFFGGGYVNRPPVAGQDTLARLAADLRAGGDPSVTAGWNRLGVETAAGAENACVYCGECYSGCFRRAIFNARTGIARALPDGAPAVRTEPVRRVVPGAGGVAVITDNGRYVGYDRVFLAAGCVGTAAIVLNSLGLHDTPRPLADNRQFVFPLLRTDGGGTPDGGDYLAIANVVAGLLPRDDTEPYAHVMLAPVPDTMLRNLLPSPLWGMAGGLGRALRGRLALGKLSVHSRLGPAHALSVDAAGALRIDTRAATGPDLEVAALRRRLRAALDGTAFWLPPAPWIETPTGGHYVGPLAYGDAAIPVDRAGQVMPGVHVCDSAAFPSAPAQPLTFTIMANARRTAIEALNG